MTHTPGRSEASAAFLAGDRIAFLSAPTRVATPAPGELWRMEFDGSAERLLLGEGCTALRVSQGTRHWLACMHLVNMQPIRFKGQVAGWSARSEVRVMRADAGRLVRVAGPGSYFLDSWAPDTAISFHEGRLGYNASDSFYEATGFPPVRAWTSAPRYGWRLAQILDPLRLHDTADRGGDWEQLRTAGVWAPDGSAFVCARWVEEDGERRVRYEYGLRGQRPARLLTANGYPEGDGWVPAICWVGASRILVQQAGQGKHSRLLLIDTSSWRSVVLTQDAAPSPNPVPSPNGDRILFRSVDRAGRPELRIVATNGGGGERVLAGDAAYTRWAWSLDGRALVVARPNADGTTDLWRIDLATSQRAAPPAPARGWPADGAGARRGHRVPRWR